jgi:hypothetical protein
MIAGTLEIQLLANIARLQSDMDSAKSTVSKAMSGIETSINAVKSAFIAMAGVGSASAFVGMIKTALDATEAFKDMSIQTGVSVERLSALAEVGRTTGTSADAISAAMNKLSKNLATTSEDGKGAAAAIKALGLDFGTFKSMRPDDQMLALAQAMNKFEDGGGKSAAAMTLMGREGAKLLPYMRDLANAGELVATVTKEQADMADAYNDAIAQSEGRVEALKRSLALNLLPTMIEVHDLSVALGKAFNDYVSAGAENAKTKMGAMHLVSTVVGTVFETLLVIGSDLAFVFNGIGREMGGIAAQGAALLRGDFAQVGEIQRALISDGEKARAELDKYQASIVGMTGKVQQASDAVAGSTVTAADNAREMRNLLGRTGETTLGQVKFTESTKEADNAAKALARELKAQENAYIALTSSIDSKLLAMNQQLDTGEKLTAAQVIENKLYQDMANSLVVLTNKELDETLAKLGQLDATERHNDLRKEEKRLADDIAKDRDADLAKMYAHTNELDRGNQSLYEQNLKLTMTDDAYVHLTANRLLDEAAQLEGIAVTSDQSEELRKQAALLRERAGLLESGIVLREARAAATEWEKTTKSIGDGLTNALTRAVLDGKDIWLTFRNYMVNVILDGVLKNAIGSVISSALSGLNSSIASIFGSAVTSAGTSAVTNKTGDTVLGNLGTSVASSTAGQYVSGSLSTAGSTALTTAGAITEAATGYNVATGVTVGGSMSTGATVVGTEMGTLGATSSAATAGSTAAGSTAMESSAAGGPYVVAAVMAAYILSEMINGGTGIEREFIESGTIPYSGTFGAITIPGQRDAGDTIYQPKADAKVTYQHQRTNTGLDEYLVLVDGIMVGAGYSMDEALKYIANPVTPPGYATGGDHPGGLRIVGETGWEVEATGPSRIWNQDQIASALRSGGANDSELVAEMRAMRVQLAQLQLDARRTADAVNGNAEAPQVVEIDT